MPAPQAVMMQSLAVANFIAQGILLPTNFRMPMGEAASQFAKALSLNNALVGIPPVPPLFMPPIINKYACDTATTVSGQFKKYIDGICSAICSAWSQWQSMATLVGVTVNAVIAAGGQVVGPPLMPLILGSAPMSTPQEMKYSNAIATAVSNGWQTYTATIKVPGLPWYPAFAAFPGPVAPPMPNIPLPVAGLTQVTVSMSKAMLKAQMIGNLGDPTAQHSVPLFDSIADSIEKCFQLWQVSTMVTNVLGMGPIPTFAPPVVPVGPVVGGIANMTPGGFA